ncbi:AAEL013241-PA [Aedes aegypti]|uniref:AAEL013241-PA n=1 Tax=Aedes aegypti TaxID=7159 RepID=Q16JR2_AEDAE|nr:AAEL013241-PA [Aedes aegypti]
MYWILAFLAVSHNTVSAQSNESAIPIAVDYCLQKSNQIYVEITRRFIQNQHFLTAIETLHNQDGKLITLHCTINGITNPLILFTLNEFLARAEKHRRNPTNRKNINPYSQLEGFLSLGSYEVFSQNLLPAFATFNPLAKIILIGRYLERQQIINLFHLAWIDYDIFNLMILNRVDSETSESCLFNPYTQSTEIIDEWNLDCHVIGSLDEIGPYMEHAKQFLHKRVSNLNKFPLKIAIADIDLMSLAVRKNGKIVRFTYLEGEIVEIMKRKMNFTTDFVILPSQLSTGFVYPNGSLGGSLDLIERDQIDLAANSRIIYSYNISNLQYLRQLTTTKLIFIVPRNYYQSRSRNRVFFNTFTWAFYSVNILIALSFPIFMKLLNRVSSETLEDSYAAAAMYTLSVTLAISTRLPNRTPARMVLCGIMLYGLVSYSIWQAITIKRLNTNNDHLDDIQSISELLDSSLVPMIPVAYSQFVKPYTGNETSVGGLQEKLYHLAKIANNNLTGALLIAEMLKTGTSAVLIHDLRAGAVLARFYDDERMQSLVHVITEHVLEFYQAMALPKDSPFLDQFNEITTQCVENGVVAYQMARIEFKGVLYMIAKGRDNHLLGICAGMQRFDLGVWKNVFFFYMGLNTLAKRGMNANYN